MPLAIGISLRILGYGRRLSIERMADQLLTDLGADWRIADLEGLWMDVEKPHSYT